MTSEEPTAVPEAGPPLRLGLIAAARITESAVVEPARQRHDVEIAGVAARDLDRARDAATRWGAARAYGGYRKLLDDDDVDAVYVATPASHHRPWVIEALGRGKHVLCEKPLGANAVDADAMVRAAERSGLMLMEGFHWRYHPYAHQIRQLVDSGVIGSLVRVEATANLPAAFFAADDIRWDLSLGGGCLMDVGCYPLHWVRWLVGSEPSVVTAGARCRTPQVDETFSARLRWDSGVVGAIESSMVEASDSRELFLRAVGTSGTITAFNPVLPQLGATLVLDTPDGRQEFAVDGSPTYEHQLTAFVEAIRSGVPPPTSGRDAVANMQLIDACYRAAGLSPRPSSSAPPD